MAKSPAPKRARTAASAAESTPISLHAADCTESAEDLQRMRDLLEEDPSLLYKVQHVPLTFDQVLTQRYFAHLGYPPPNNDAPPLWPACQAKHLICVNLILQASGPENVKHLDEFKLKISDDPIRVQNILSHCLRFGEGKEKSCKIMKLLLEHGISPNVEIPISEIKNPQIVQILEQYKATKLIFPSRVLLVAVENSYSEILDLLFEHGAYPDPVILTESGSVLPLYPTLGKHLNPIPSTIIDLHPEILKEDILYPLIGSVLYYNISLKHVECIKKMLVHGASVPPFVIRNHFSRIIQQVLFPLGLINTIKHYAEFREDAHDDLSPWGVKPNGLLVRYYDIILEILKLYHQFGGSLWWKMKSYDVPCEGGRGECVEWLRDPERVTPCQTIIDVLEERIRDPEAQSMLVGEVQRMMSTPHSLQHSARLAIRRSMGYGCVRNLEALPLHNHLKKYLKFEFETK